MRKDARRVEWTTGDVRYLLEHAGIDSKRSICRHLRRSAKAVERKADQLRKEGHRVSLRVYETLTVICPKCGEARSKEGRWTSSTGICEVCRMRDQLQEHLWRQAEAYAALPPADKLTYEGQLAKSGRNPPPPRPRAPQTVGLPPQRARRLEELHAIEVERWEKLCLTREINRAKQLVKRMREKTGTNPRKGR